MPVDVEKIVVNIAGNVALDDDTDRDGHGLFASLLYSFKASMVWGSAETFLRDVTVGCGS